MSVVSLRGVSRLWEGNAGLHPIDVEVSAGEMVVVRGRSGSGKSTLLALVAGLCAPDAGDISVLGVAPRADVPWCDVALVPQVLALSAELSILENVTDCAPAVDPQHVAEVMRRLDVWELAGRAIDEVSMGQQQRTALARAIAAAPTVVLADEPTSFQDEFHTGVVVSALRAAADGGAAILVATHDDAVARAADRVIELTHAA